MAEKLRVLMIGTASDYSMMPLHQIDEHHELVGVVESAPRNSRSIIHNIYMEAIIKPLLRGRPSLWLYARRRAVPYDYLTAQSMHRLKRMITSTQADICCVASMNQMLPPDILGVPPFGFINFHPSLLPKYRGPNVWFWLYHQMERESGATIHFLDEGEDTGDVVRQESFDIETGMPPRRLMRRTIELGARLMVEALDDIALGRVERKPQRHLACALRARYLKAGEDLFDWESWSLEHTYHFLSGAYLWYQPFKRAVYMPSFCDWRAVSYQAGSNDAPFGKIRLDQSGFYFSHPAGNIRLHLKPDVRWMLLLLLLALAVLNLIFNG